MSQIVLSAPMRRLLRTMAAPRPEPVVIACLPDAPAALRGDRSGICYQSTGIARRTIASLVARGLLQRLPAAQQARDGLEYGFTTLGRQEATQC